MKFTLTSPVILLIAACVIACALILGNYSTTQVKAAGGFLPASIATTSNPTVGTTGIVIFATSTCAARVITTVASPIMLTFSDYAGQTPTATFGHLQPASTTVSYDSGIYGCGLVKAYGFVSSAITVSESR